MKEIYESGFEEKLDNLSNERFNNISNRIKLADYN
jgi:hypothetical protein